MTYKKGGIWTQTPIGTERRRWPHSSQGVPETDAQKLERQVSSPLETANTLMVDFWPQ
jgi:hypothetical protein